jgi:alpha-D-ribose 1-methylphosphonate 5-triphosphate synthase subunit PhnL
MTDASHAGPLVRVEGLTKQFTLHVLHGKRVPAFHDVSFDVPRAGITAVIGPSGSGKSSLLKCMYRTYLPTSGRMLLDTADGTVDIATADDHTILALRKRAIGYVPQFLRAPPRVPAVEVVVRPLIERGVPHVDAFEQAVEMLGRLNLPSDLFDAYPALFSGGEQQRVNIARALVARTDLLLLDEPTSALDHINLERVIALLREACADGTTIVGVFHDYAVVEALADVVVAIEHGTVRSIGPWASVPKEYRSMKPDAA